MHNRPEKIKKIEMPAEIEYGIPKQERTFGISRNNKSLLCPFQAVVCQESYYSECQMHLNWQRRKNSGSALITAAKGMVIV